MAIIPQPQLFSWEHIDASSGLERLRMALGALPDEALTVAVGAASPAQQHSIASHRNTACAGSISSKR